MDHGRLVAEGTSRQLKQQVAADSVVVSIQEDGAGSDAARKLLADQEYVREVGAEADHLRLYVDDGMTALPKILRLLDRSGMTIKTITLSEPTLDDVFLRHTGRSLRDAGQQQADGARQ